MALYLNNLDLNGNQLIKAVVHPLGTAPSTAQEGQIYYDTGDNVVYVNTSTSVNSPTWVNMQSGDLTGVTADGGLTGTATSGAVTLAVGAGTGITVNADDVAITAAQTGITSILNTSLTKIGTAGAQEYITFGTSNEVNTFVNNTERLSVTATGVDITGALTVSGSYNLASGDIPDNAADTTGTAATVTGAAQSAITSVGTLTTLQVDNININGNTITSSTAADLTINVTDGQSVVIEGLDIDDGVVTGASSITSTAFVGALTGNASGTALTVTQAAQTAITSVGTLTGLTVSGNISANGSIIGDDGTNITNIDTISLDKVEADGTTINIGNQASKTVFLGKAESSSGAADGTGITVREHLSVLGDITIAGGVTLESTSNTAIKDTNLVLNFGFDSENLNNKDLGFIFERGSGTNVGFRWDETNDTFDLIATPNAGNEAVGTFGVAPSGTNEFVHAIGSSATGWQNLKINKLTAPGGVVGNVTGNASGSSATVTNIGNLTGDVTSSNRATTIGAGKVHHGMLAEDIISGQGSITTLTQTDLLAVHDTSASTVKQISLTNFEDQIFANINTASSEVSVAAGGAITIADNTADTSGNAATATKIASITNSNIVQLAGAQTLTGTKTLNSFKGTGSVTVTNILDADDMSGASATTLATSESIKAYVDSQGSSASNTGGRQAFVLNSTTSGVAATSTTVFTITHGMGSSRNYGVEIIRNSANSGGGETVIVDVARPTDTTITVTFAVAPTAGDYTALVCKY